MQQFLSAWVEIEIDRLSRNNKLIKIRVENVTKSASEYVVVHFQLADSTVKIPYEYWGSMDFSKALGTMLELVFEKYPGSVRIEKVPKKLIYDFYLSEKN